VPGYFPKDVPPDAGDFDVVSMLALFGLNNVFVFAKPLS
jgi:hypothetical protein